MNTEFRWKFVHYHNITYIKLTSWNMKASKTPRLEYISGEN